MFNISIQISSTSLSVKVIASFIVGVVESFLGGMLCHRVSRRIEDEANLYIEYRKPKEIKSWELGETPVSS